ncbi:MAG: AAA family ATPase [Nocardioidaceae bacterium]
MPAGGAERICAWLDAHPDARLVIVDVFAKVRGAGIANGNQYEADYTAMSALKRIADHYGVAVLVVHHTRKAGPRTTSTKSPAPMDWPGPPMPSPSCVANEEPRTPYCTSPAAMSRKPSTRCPGWLGSVPSTCSPGRRPITFSNPPADPSSTTSASTSPLARR